MTIIPAIDIIDGKCVRLVKGDYRETTIYHEDPLAMALKFEDAGARRLHLVDLDGARTGEVQNWKVLETLASRTRLQIDFSGGIRTTEEVTRALDAGSHFIALGSLAATAPEKVMEWVGSWGADSFIIGADVRDEQVSVRGWTEQTALTVYELIESFQARGVSRFFCTDISRDGMLQGSAIDLYREILKRSPGIELIASGGVQSVSELEELESAGCSGAIIGKALYEGKIQWTELERFLT